MQNDSATPPASVIQTKRPTHDLTTAKPKWWHYFLAGELAGMCGSVVCHPFDTAKTKIQMIPTVQQSTFAFMRSIVMKDGVAGLYRGVAFPFFGFGVVFSITFGVNGLFRNHFISINEQDSARTTPASQLSLAQAMTGGGFAGGVSSIFRTPIERVKTWSQIHHTSTVRSCADLLSRYGFIRGLWYGILPTMGREVPQFAVYYPIYEVTCSLLTTSEKSGDKTALPNWKIFVSGASAGVGCWIVTYPIDVVKTHIQAAPPGTYSGVMQATSAVYAQGGMRVFWNGLMPTVYRAAALHSAIFLVYERALTLIQERAHF